jgi:hypothetical protein
MSYRDKTFCVNTDCPEFSECDRALTDEIREEAKKAGMLISQQKFDCEV